MLIAIISDMETYENQIIYNEDGSVNVLFGGAVDCGVVFTKCKSFQLLLKNQNR